MPLARVLTTAVVLLTGFSGAQLPEFAQQYRQRLGGAVDELRASIEQFDADARAEGLTRTAALERHAANTDELFRRRGQSMVGTIDRYGNLNADKQALDQSAALGLVATFMRTADPAIARATLHDYAPAIPVTAEGGIMAAIGAAIGWLLARLAGLPFRLRRKARPAR